MFLSSSKPMKENGQGLVEYALILVLVAIVVIAALLILGPGIGNVFSTVNDSLSGVGGGGGDQVAAPSTAAPDPTWTTCASEGGYCSFSGTAPVRYGANGIWTTRTYTNGVSCTNGVFGDPVPGTVKSCQVYQ